MSTNSPEDDTIQNTKNQHLKKGKFAILKGMFYHLRTHSHYSLLKALPKVDALVKQAKAYGMDALAITDYNTMYSAIDFYKECEKKEMKAILGSEFTHEIDGREFKLVLLARTDEGYKNLMRISSEVMMGDPHHPLLKREWLKKYGEGLICLSGGPWGDISLLLISHEAKAKALVMEYESYFGKGNFYLEVTPHTYMERGAEMREKTITFGRKEGIPLVATINSHYLKDGDKNAHKYLYLIEGSEHGAEEYNEIFSKGNFSFISSQDAEKIFADVPEAIANTEKIKNDCNAKIELGKWVFPNIEFEVSYDEDLRKLAYAALTVRNMELTEEVRTRLDYELKVIKDKGYSPYFLVVYDLLRYARENGILTNIRGSVAGSLVTYLLRITKCNPFQYKLPFERFLNPERPSAPDIDMDFSDSRRDEVLDYARRKYGIDNVAQIGTFGTMMARGAVRDVARAMKFPYIVGDRISKLIPPPRQGFPVFIENAIKEVEELKELYETDREAQMILDMARQIEGCARHISVHAAGTVISPLALTEFTPIQKDPKGGKIITQYDMYTIEDAGLLKFDFLGIRNLTILADAINLVKETYGVVIDIEDIPLDDKKTFEMLAAGATIGLFQLNGSGMTRFLKELKPTTIYDINAMVALYRPGPLEMIPEYIKRKHDPSQIAFLDPRLEQILDQSFGVIVYQDDVMLIAIHLAGYSWLEADKLRKAMGKKIPAEMEAQKEKLFKGFKANGLSEKKIALLWEQIEPFAAYGFNKAHAASYGRVAYQTAYMKANFPFAYMTSVMTNESGDVEKIAEIVSECKRMGIEVLPPDVNTSQGGFSIVKEGTVEKIRFGLYTIKNLGEEISNAIITEREKGGTFTSIEDFIGRVHHKLLNKKSLEALTLTGATDSLCKRSLILENMEALLEHHKVLMREKETGQNSLFVGMSSTPPLKLKEGKEHTHLEKLAFEKELLGLYVSGSPLDPWKKTIEERSCDIGKVLHEFGDGKAITIGVIVENVRITKTKKGDLMALLTLSDYTGSLEVAVFPESYKKYKALCVPNVTLLVKGKVASRNGEKTMVVDELKKLGES